MIPDGSIDGLGEAGFRGEVKASSGGEEESFRGDEGAFTPERPFTPEKDFTL